jgi:hypothetical protein
MRERAWQWANKTRRCGEIQSRRRIARALVFDVFTTKGPDKVRSGEGRGGPVEGEQFMPDACPMPRRSWKRAGRLKRVPRLRHRCDLSGPGTLLGRPITLFTIRTAIISQQQSEPAGFSILSARDGAKEGRAERE